LAVENRDNPRGSRGRPSDFLDRSLLICLNWRIEMPKRIWVVLYVLAVVAVVVTVDLLFLRGLTWERLIVNIGIVLVFASFYFVFLRKR
jgi:hypothetical protein